MKTNPRGTFGGTDEAKNKCAARKAFHENLFTYSYYTLKILGLATEFLRHAPERDVFIQRTSTSI